MVKVIALTVAVLAFWTCAPAQADVVAVPAPPAAVPAPVQDVVARATPVVTKVTETAHTTTAPTRSAVSSATVAATETTARVAQGRAGETEGLHVGPSSVRRVQSASLRRAEPARERTAPSRAEHRPAAHLTQAPAAVHREPGHAKADGPAARPEHQSPPNPAPAPRSDGGVSAGTSALFAGGLGMLAGALILVAPRWRRRLSPERAVLRPVAFVALLERPG